ncbi:705_t:CDS:2 [Dentiscutata erythropus]|uniref:705_t:CDS:1 n=1 Tax=Dentiscutata erythropus TaxID=1348616 RepID=A0A9N8ZDH4_9GLOM|nr:705_t:CDS:2 [Dentiscutata erythropus]
MITCSDEDGNMSSSFSNFKLSLKSLIFLPLSTFVSFIESTKISSSILMDAGDIMEHEMKSNEQNQAVRQKEDALKKRHAEKLDIPRKKWNKMVEKAHINNISLVYIFVAVLAVLLAWMKFLKWTEKWEGFKFWEGIFV